MITYDIPIREFLSEPQRASCGLYWQRRMSLYGGFSRCPFWGLPCAVKSRGLNYILFCTVKGKEIGAIQSLLYVPLNTNLIKLSCGNFGQSSMAVNRKHKEPDEVLYRNSLTAPHWPLGGMEMSRHNILSEHGHFSSCDTRNLKKRSTVVWKVKSVFTLFNERN